MPFNVQSLRQIIKTGEQDIEIELDEQLPPVGVERALNIAFSGAVRDVYDHQTWIADQVVPSPRSDDQTIIDTANAEGVIRKAATYATGKAVFKGSQPIPINTEMQARNGNGYHVITASAPGNGVQTVTIQADDVGASGNLDAAAQLTLVSPFLASRAPAWWTPTASPAAPILNPLASCLTGCCFANATRRWAVLSMITSSGRAKWLGCPVPGRGMPGTAAGR